MEKVAVILFGVITMVGAIYAIAAVVRSGQLYKWSYPRKYIMITYGPTKIRAFAIEIVGLAGECAYAMTSGDFLFSILSGALVIACLIIINDTVQGMRKLIEDDNRRFIKHDVIEVRNVGTNTNHR